MNRTYKNTNKTLKHNFLYNNNTSTTSATAFSSSFNNFKAMLMKNTNNLEETINEIN